MRLSEEIPFKTFANPHQAHNHKLNRANLYESEMVQTYPDLNCSGASPTESRVRGKMNLECRKWGFKRWGFKEIRGYLRKKAFFFRFLDFPGALRTLRKGRKRQKKGEKARFRPISGKGGQTPLKPPFVTPPFAAAQ